jgi:hypothetical protein
MPGKHKPTKESLRKGILIAGLPTDIVELTKRNFQLTIEHFSRRQQTTDMRS